MRVKEWKKQIQDLEDEIKAKVAAPRASSGVLASSLGVFAPVAPETTMEESINPQSGIRTLQEGFVLPSTTFSWSDLPPHEVINALVGERNLSKSQALAFTIAARHFFEQLAGKDHASLQLEFGRS
ncbi:hypothetical protein OC842_005208 [Tilletia horrida]|uniref:Uncharacterized protein n=1 Tax=Tilletia horrida TaxID=155126 RepID=A0AAN6GAR5_9BASI|nr:hypothetical protein OC842_005208 [Tilletia horrida]